MTDNTSAYIRALTEYITASNREYRFRLRKLSDDGNLSFTALDTVTVGPAAGQNFIDTTPDDPGDPAVSRITWDGDPITMANDTAGVETASSVVVDILFGADWRLLGECYFDPRILNPDQQIVISDIQVELRGQ